MVRRISGLRVLFSLIGCALIFAAAMMLWSEHTRYSDWERNIPFVADKLLNVLPPQTAATVGERDGNTMPRMEIEGNDYIGLLEAPQYGVVLPILGNWDDKRLEMRPARLVGSVYEGSLIIGMSPIKQLDFLSEMNDGTEFSVTDLYGSVYTYCVERVHHYDEIGTSLLISMESDLILFMKKGHQYLVVSCALK